MATPPFLLPYPFPYPSQDSWLPWMWFPWHLRVVAILRWPFPGCCILGMDCVVVSLASQGCCTLEMAIPGVLHPWNGLRCALGFPTGGTLAVGFSPSPSEPFPSWDYNPTRGHRATDTRKHRLVLQPGWRKLRWKHQRSGLRHYTGLYRIAHLLTQSSS